jgi:hypothetical protein
MPRETRRRTPARVQVGLISYVRGKMQVLDRPGLEKASCKCYAIVKARFDAEATFLCGSPPSHQAGVEMTGPASNGSVCSR